jgi:uncharacterized protein YjdB
LPPHISLSNTILNNEKQLKVMKKTILVFILLYGSLKMIAQPITGATSLCAGSSTTLSNAATGGIWVSSTLSVATIDSFSGNLNGLLPGTTVISYNFSGGSSVTATITVNPLPATISGVASECAGSGATFTDATSGGTWSSSNNTVAMVDDSTGFVVGITGDTASIIYTTTNGCSRSAIITINPMPPAIVATGIYCTGIVDTLYEISGGTWSTGTPSLVSIGALAGNITGLAQGMASITYTLPSGCAASTTITINPSANAGIITGNDFVCLDGSITCTSNECCGVWSSSDAALASVGSLTGMVSGHSAGVVMIQYSVTNSCGTDTALFALEILSSDTCNKLNVGKPDLVSNEMEIAPNPSYDGNFILTIKSDIAENARIIITNVTGEKVKEFNTLTNKKNEIKLETTAGIYFISATTGNSKYEAKIAIE